MRVIHLETRGGKETPEYAAWKHIRQRCLNPRHSQYSDYGGRGIKMCARWIESFNNFLDDMGRRPSATHSIDRIDNDSDYTPGNCRWATHREQNRNCRSNRRLSHGGKTLTISEWSEATGLAYGTLYRRVKAGWDTGRALFTPVERRPI